MPRQWIEDCRTVNCKHLHRNKALFFQTQVSIGEFIAAVENGSFYNKTTHGKEAPYFFGPLKLIDGEYAEVYKIVKKLFPENLFRRKNSNRGKDKDIFFIGPIGSGTYFHSHEAAANILFHGKKNGFCYLPCRMLALEPLACSGG